MTDLTLAEDVRLYSVLLAATAEPSPRQPLVLPDPDTEALTALVLVSVLDLLADGAKRFLQPPDSTTEPLQNATESSP